MWFKYLSNISFLNTAVINNFSYKLFLPNILLFIVQLEGTYEKQ